MFVAFSHAMNFQKGEIMKTYSRVCAALLVLLASLLAATVYAQERSTQRPATTIKQQPVVALEPQARVKSTPTPTPTPGAKLKRPLGKQPAVAEEMQTRQPSYPQMPGVIGVELGNARSIVVRIQPNAKLSVLEGRYTNNYPPGVVINQSPERGTPLKPGAEVILYSNPQPPVTYPKMPGLIGLDFSTAVRRLSALTRGSIQPRRAMARRNNPNYAPEAVVIQSPAEGADLKPGTEVVLYLNPQPPPTPSPVYPKMPSLIGADLGVAGATLQREAPNVPVRRVMAASVNPTYGAGVIVSQFPNAGTELRSGIEIVLTVNPRSRPTPTPTPVQRNVPEVRGLNYGEASGVLASLQLRIAATSNPVGNFRDFRVTEQRPQPGATLPIGGTVSVDIAPPPTPTPSATPTPTPTPSRTPTPAPSPVLVVVPDVGKKGLTDAINSLRNAQLDVGDVTQKDPKDNSSYVLEQQPLPGQRVAAGTRVNLVIGKQVETGGILKELPKVFGVMGLGFMAFLLGRLWKRIWSKKGGSQDGIPTLKSPSDPVPQTIPPALSFRTTMDSSSSEFAASTDLHVGFALRFLPKADWGQQHITLTGDLIAAESEEL